jgi:hypothetical protein
VLTEEPPRDVRGGASDESGNSVDADVFAGVDEFKVLLTFYPHGGLESHFTLQFLLEISVSRFVPPIGGFFLFILFVHLCPVLTLG